MPHSRSKVSRTSSSSQLELPNLRPLRVLVIGEVILDRYLWGDVARISPEAPIPVLRVERREERPGNAGFVAANLRALGAEASIVSLVGRDRGGLMLREILGGGGVCTGPLVENFRPGTIPKERKLGCVEATHRGTQQLLRVDEEDVSTLRLARERQLIARVAAELPRADGVLICDINKGLLTPQLLRATIDSARRRKIPVVIDPRLTEDLS